MKTVFSNDVFARDSIQSAQWVKPVGLRLAGSPVPDLRYSSQPRAASLVATQTPVAPLTSAPAPQTIAAPVPGSPVHASLGQGFLGIDLGDVADLIGELPAEVAKSFTDRLDQCYSLLRQGKLTEAASCGQKLYDEIQAIRRGQQDGDPISTTPPVAAPPAGEFPWIPVAIGVAGVGVLVYILYKSRQA